MLHKIKNYRAERARRKLMAPNQVKSTFKKWRVLAILGAILAMSTIVYAICFAYKAPLVHPVISGQSGTIHLVSPFDFSYVSNILTEREREQKAESIPPSYSINPEPFNAAASRAESFEAFLDENQAAYENLAPEEKSATNFFEKIAIGAQRASAIKASTENVRVFYKDTNQETRAEIFGKALGILKEILANGVYRDDDALFTYSGEGPAPAIDSREPLDKRLDQTSAREKFRTRLGTLKTTPEVIAAVYDSLYLDIVPNIVFDEEKTKERRAEARSRVQPVEVKVREDETLHDGSTPSSKLAADLVAEKMKAFQSESLKRGESISPTGTKYTDFVACLLLIVTATLFIVISRSSQNKKPRTVVIFCVLLTLSLAMERLFVHLSNTQLFDGDITLLQIFAYGTPIMLGPIIMVLLFGSYLGFVMAILIAALVTMMVGESVGFFILLLASALVAIYFCSGATSRYRVILGGIIYGLFIAVFSFTIGMLADQPMYLVWRQSALAIVAGGVTGVFATVVLPVFERIFRRYSNIALLEYTDFNNPILRRLQIEAPGTYHHSIMVSYLSEAAAAAVGANPMVCRIGALYHDIGKIMKPEFFSENQKDGRNLHDDQNPSMSALIIRNHVREGMELAKAAKLPQQVIDSIQQHHGTTIIAYFYNKAMKLAEHAEQNVDPSQALRDAGIEESTFRHDGVKPQTVENAIIMLADSCEAASRSLKKITKHGVEDLVSVIVRSKMNDGQLDNCPITVKQLSIIKESFVFTMLNMLHTRVQYNNGKK